MTEDTQELGEILDEFLTDIYMNNEHFAANQEALDKTKEEPMRALLDWHNKRELEARIDTLEYAKISPKFKIEEKIEQLRLELNKYE